MIPKVAAQKLATFCDVFVEKGAFTVEEGRRILRAGKRHGLRPKVHADQFRDGGGAQLAVDVGAISAEHLDATGPRGIAAIAKAGVIPVLLPGCCLFLGLERPNARAMIEAGCAVALATDFNPGSSPTENLHLIASLGCTLLGMTPEEAIVAITRNAAAAAGLEGDHGRIARGRRADLLVLDAPSYEHLPYRLGTNLTHMVVVGGKIVVERGRRVGVKRRS
jgi:imidazolonepropionase